MVIISQKTNSALLECSYLMKGKEFRANLLLQAIESVTGERKFQQIKKHYGTAQLLCNWLIATLNTLFL